MLKLLVGLGNPGPEYEATRHNAGFWWIDAVARELKTSLSLDRSYNGLLARTTYKGRPLWLLEPMTYMNESGKSVGALARFFKIQPEEILVAHDELDIVPGEVKLKRGGGHAGHNGLRSLHAHLGSDDYWRLRIGVGHPGIKSEVANWVLKKPAPDHRTAIEDAMIRTLQALPDLLDGAMDKATMHIHTSKPPRPKPPKPAQAKAPADDPAAPTPQASQTTIQTTTPSATDDKPAA
jgi:PTH1 family peptidyl-tRNA hydrolase